MSNVASVPFAPGTRAIHRSYTGDLPVTITGVMGESGGERYYSGTTHVNGYTGSGGIEESKLITDPSQVARFFTAHGVNVAPDASLDTITLDSVDNLAFDTPTPTPTPQHRAYQPTRHELLLSAALAYAERGLYVIPIHEPLFDKDGKLTGCSCEAYKRSKKYFEWLRSKGLEKKFDPKFTCRTPGKHPRVGSDWEAKASNRPTQIREWWHKWPTANIGMPAGKNGLLLFDQDTYKEAFTNADLLTFEETETPTVLSGRGGENLIYLMPTGKAYGNDTGDLPPGIDIRGVGGQFVVWPSIHPCGRLYEWEDGFSILERDPRPLPVALEAILDAAHAKRTPAKAVTFTTPTTEKPDLLRWRTSAAIRELIHNPPPKGDRSEADHSVCLSLCYAGATDDDILSVFQHYTIGTAGKYAESGPRYLALTIGKARAYVELHPRPDVGATIAAARLSIKTHNLSAHVGPGPGSKKVRLVADGAFDLMAEDGKLTITVGKKRLGKQSGVSPTTAANALALLHGVLFDVTPTESGYTITLVENCRLQKFDPSLSIKLCVKTGGQIRENDCIVSNDTPNVYSPNKANEPFLTGTSRHMRQRIQALAEALDISTDQAKADYTFAGLGEGVLLAYDTSFFYPGMTAQEYADHTGIKLSAARTHLRRAEKMGLAESSREGSRGPKCYTFASDFGDRVIELAPNLRTFQMTSRREDKRLESAQQWCKKGIAEAQAAQDAEQEQRLDRRFAKLAKERLPHLERLHPDLTPKDIERLAYEVDTYKRSPQTEHAIRTQHTTQRDEHCDEVRMIRELAHVAVQHFADIGLTRPTLHMLKTEIMKFGIFDETFVLAVLDSPTQRANYEKVADVRTPYQAWMYAQD